MIFGIDKIGEWDMMELRKRLRQLKKGMHHGFVKRYRGSLRSFRGNSE